ncbi:MAG TPA: esterase-like activity of phytase family protein, partial [Phenylobacterium sp.]
GRAYDAGDVPNLPVLPALAAERRTNRGFEGLAVSPDEQRLYVAAQSALEPGGAPEPFVRIWTLDAASGELLAEHGYVFDPPTSFRRDAEQGAVERGDLKICDLLCIGEDRLLVLERITASAKIYQVQLRGGEAAEPAGAGMIPRLAKTLLFSTDDHPGVAPDVEGMAQLSDTELMLVTDNDFGVGGSETAFYVVTFAAPL